MRWGEVHIGILLCCASVIQKTLSNSTVIPHGCEKEYLHVKPSVEPCFQVPARMLISKLDLGAVYGGELTRSGGLACLGEISPSLRNSFKNMSSYEKRSNPPRWDLAWFCRDPTQVRWKFPIWTRASGPTR